MRIVKRIVIIFFKYNTFYFTPPPPPPPPPRKTRFQPYFAVLFAFYCQLKSGKYHPVVALLHNHKWLKKISKKFSSGFETVQCVLSSILCPSIFREILKHDAIAMARRFSAR